MKQRQIEDNVGQYISMMNETLSQT